MNTQSQSVMDARKVERVRFEHVYCPFNPKYPGAWRGNTVIRAFLFGRIFRLSLSYRHYENDWMKVDTARRWDVSPRFAKWFNVCSYYAGNFRNMYHLHIGRIGFSIIPATSIRSA